MRLIRKWKERSATRDESHAIRKNRSHSTWLAASASSCRKRSKRSLCLALRTSHTHNEIFIFRVPEKNLCVSVCCANFSCGRIQLLGKIAFSYFLFFYTFFFLLLQRDINQRIHNTKDPKLDVYIRYSQWHLAVHRRTFKVHTFVYRRAIPQWGPSLATPKPPYTQERFSISFDLSVHCTGMRALASTSVTN